MAILSVRQIDGWLASCLLATQANKQQDSEAAEGKAVKVAKNAHFMLKSSELRDEEVEREEAGWLAGWLATEWMDKTSKHELACCCEFRIDSQFMSMYE